MKVSSLISVTYSSLYRSNISSPQKPIHGPSSHTRSQDCLSDPASINGDTTQNLHYLFAVIEEGLRIYPPVPAGLQRVSPGAEVDGYYVPAGAIVSTSNWTTSHTEKYFHNAREFHPLSAGCWKTTLCMTRLIEMT